MRWANVQVVSEAWKVDYLVVGYSEACEQEFSIRPALSRQTFADFRGEFVAFILKSIGWRGDGASFENWRLSVGQPEDAADKAKSQYKDVVVGGHVWQVIDGNDLHAQSNEVHFSDYKSFQMTFLACQIRPSILVFNFMPIRINIISQSWFL